MPTVNNVTKPMEIAKFPSYQQAFIEVREILEMSAENKDFVVLPKIEKQDDDWYLVTIVVKPREK
jgi:hypothetical protein